jgi:hypothetical protein
MLRRGCGSRRTWHPTMLCPPLIKNKIPNSASRHLSFIAPCGRPHTHSAALSPPSPVTPGLVPLGASVCCREEDSSAKVHCQLPAAPPTATAVGGPGRQRLTLHLQAPCACSTTLAAPSSLLRHALLRPPPHPGQAPGEGAVDGRA